jgi:basic membrane protein A
MAEAGANPIYCVWDDVATEAVNLAEEFPNTKFINVDCYVTGESENIKTIVVEPQQATFIAGVVAAHTTETGKVAWLGSMDNPVINKFREGFEAGVAYVDNGTTCESLYIGDANDPNKGGELAKQVIGKGADIVMHSANQSGLGVIRACEEAGVKAIGVDEWQGALNEEVVFWSALKDITGAVYEAGKSVMEDTFEAGMSVHDSSTGAALFDERDYNKLSDDLKAIVDDVVAKLASGEIVIETAE